MEGTDRSHRVGVLHLSLRAQRVMGEPAEGGRGRGLSETKRNAASPGHCIPESALGCVWPLGLSGEQLLSGDP